MRMMYIMIILVVRGFKIMIMMCDQLMIARGFESMIIIHFFFIGQVEAYTPHWQPHTHMDLYIATRRNVLSGLHEWS